MTPDISEAAPASVRCLPPHWPSVRCLPPPSPAASGRVEARGVDSGREGVGGALCWRGAAAGGVDSGEAAARGNAGCGEAGTYAG